MIVAKLKFSSAFRNTLSEKLMDLGNYAAVGLVIGQLVSKSEFSNVLLLLGISSTAILYFAGYVISL